VKTLAFVIFTITSGDMAGVEIYTPDPRRCEATVDGFLKKLASIGILADSRCLYTAAPETSPRPHYRRMK